MNKRISVITSIFSLCVILLVACLYAAPAHAAKPPR